MNKEVGDLMDNLLLLWHVNAYPALSGANCTQASTLVNISIGLTDVHWSVVALRTR